MAKKHLGLILGILFLLVLPLVLAQLATVGDGDSGTVNVGGDNNGGVTVGPVYIEPCGNGVVEISKGEQCDGNNLAGLTCSGLGYNSGTLSCFDANAGTSKCTYNNQCYNSTAPSGDTGGSSGGGSGGSGGSSSCVENWTCSDWNACDNGNQTRTCSDSKKCGTTKLKPVLQRECSVEGASGDEGIGAPATPKGFLAGITGAVIGGGVGSIIAVIVLVVILVGLWILVTLLRNRKAPKYK